MNEVQKDLLQVVIHALDWDSVLGLDRIVLCALSGGPDSMALCDILDRAGEPLAIRLFAAHLNHGIRGRESDADEEFVRGFCLERGIPLEIGKADIPSKAAESGLSVEMAARSARYEFLAEVAARIGTQCVALGHTADDRVETLLMRLLRGAGGRGLGSLQPVRRYTGLTLLRPLLGVFRRQVIAYLARRDLEWRTDSTNLETTTDRGRIRNLLLPRLVALAEESGWSGTLESLARSAELLSEDETHFQSLADEFLAGVVFEERRQLRLPVDRFRHLPSPILARLVLTALQMFDADLRPEREHIDAIISMLAGVRDAPCDIPGGLRAEPTGDAVIIGPPVEIKPPEPIEISLDQLPCTWRFGPYTIRIAPVEGEEKRTQTPVGPSQLGATVTLPDGCEAIVIRTMQPGDRMAPMGMRGHTKKVSDIFTDRKVPRHERPVEPVVEARPCGTVLALPRLSLISEGAKVTSESGSAVRVIVSARLATGESV